MKVNNPSVASDVRRILSTRGENVEEVGDVLIPTIEIKPKVNIVRSATSAVTGTTAIYTTPADKEFYLIGFILGYQCSAACDGTAVTITATIDGVTQNIADLRHITLTATTRNEALSFYYPIRIDRNTAINLNATFGAGALTKTAVIYGYTIETSADSVN